MLREVLKEFLDDGKGKGKGKGGGGGKDDPEPPKDGKKYKKGKFLTTAYKEATILAEPKLPWHKKLSRFAAHHPILTTLIGAGVGLVATATGAGVFAAAGLTGGILANAVSNAVGLAMGTGIGLVAGGTTAIVASNIPAGRAARLCKKFMKQYKKCQTIDRKKEWQAAQEITHESKAEMAREKMRTGSKLLKSLGVYKLARDFHKSQKKKAKEKRRYWTRQYAKSVDSAIVAKGRVNNHEIARNKSYALAGYVEKKRKLEQAHRNGELTDEEFAEDMEDLAQDFADLDGGSEGLEDVGSQLYGDYEAEEIISKVQGKKSKTMTDMLERIDGRKTKVVSETVETKVVRDFDEWQAEIDAMDDPDKKAKAQAELDKVKKERADYEAAQKRKGAPVEPLKDATEDEIEDLLGK